MIKNKQIYKYEILIITQIIKLQRILLYLPLNFSLVTFFMENVLQYHYRRQEYYKIMFVYASIPVLCQISYLYISSI